MNGATRYTTSSRPSVLDTLGSAALGLLIRPPVLGAAVAGAGAVELRLPWRVVVVIALITGMVVELIRYYRANVRITARLKRSMTELGLVYRHEDGQIEPPRLRGRTIWIGRNARLRWRLPPGVTLRDVVNRQEAIEHRCDCELAIRPHEGGDLLMDVYRHRIPEMVPYERFYSTPRPHGRLLVGLGRGRRGDLWVDLSTLPHLLVGGMTGGGKSVFLAQALTFIATEYTPKQVRIACIDLKGGVELARFGELPHAWLPVVDTIPDAASALSEIRVELDRRLSALRLAGLRDIDGWLDAGHPEWPRVLVVVDELAELTVRDLGDDKAARAAQQAALGRLCEIARLGRAAGIHLILCTQRPDAEAVPGQLKANLAGTVAFRVRAAVNSLILLDSDRASLLPPHPGRGVWGHEGAEEFQGIYVSGQESDRIVRQRWSIPPVATTPTVPVTPWVQTPGDDELDVFDWNSML